MMKKETNVDILKNRIEHHSATDADWKEAKRQLKTEREEHERQRKEAALRHQAWQKEQEKPKNFVPKQAPSMHVKENLMDFEKLCAKCDLPALKQYTLELASGEHVADFKGKDTTPVVQFLLAQIAKHEGTKPAAKTEKANKQKLEGNYNTAKAKAYTT